MRGLLLSVFGLLACLTWAPATVSAQISDADRESARAHFDRGTVAFERGDYAEAVAEFRAAYELTRHPDLLYNVYTSQERNGELAEAADALEAYLRDGSPTDARREALEVRLERLHARIAEREAQEARQALQREQERAANAEQLREAEAQVVAEREARSARVRADRATADALFVSGLVVVGVAAAGLVSFGVFAGLSEAEDQALAGGCGMDDSCLPAQVADLQTFNVAADASWIGAAAVGLVGGVLLVLSEAMRPPAAVRDTEQAWWSPRVGPSQLGVDAGGRF